MQSVLIGIVVVAIVVLVVFVAVAAMVSSLYKRFPRARRSWSRR
ncbi:MAG: hypothetical protein R2706_06110 [Acidimicrobiales bacterium]